MCRWACSPPACCSTPPLAIHTGDFFHIFWMKQFQTPSWTICPFSDNTLYYSKLLLSRIRSSKNDHRALPGGKERAPGGWWLPLLPLAVRRNLWNFISTQSEVAGHGDTRVPTRSLPSLSNHGANHRLNFSLSQQCIMPFKRLYPLGASRPKSCACRDCCSSESSSEGRPKLQGETKQNNSMGQNLISSEG